VRTFFLLFLLAWLLGIGLGVSGFNLSIVLVAAALVGAVVFLLRERSPIVFGALALVWLGFVWAAVSGGVAAEQCEFAAPSQVRVVERVELQERRVRFVAETATGCRALVTAGRFTGIGEGDTVRLSGGDIESLSDVGEYSAGYASYLERQGISATWRYPNTNVIRHRRLWIQSVHDDVRARVQEVFVEPDASVVLAVLFADRGTLPEHLVDQFRYTGVSHVLAISGLHVSLLVGMLVGLMLLLPIGPKTRTLLALVLLWLYIIFIGAPTSAVRAASFWTVTLSALQLYLLISLPTVLLLAGGALVSLQPQYLTDVGWQLSVSAVVGIFLALFLARPWLHGLGGPKRFVISLVLVSLGATLGTGPLVAYHFGNVALSGVVTNVLVVPFVPALLALAILALLLSVIFMPAALLAAYVVHAIIAWIDLATRIISSVPWLFWEEVVVPLWFLPVYYVVLVALSAAVLRWQKRSWREVWG